MARLEAATVDAIVTDPPYGYGIGGKRWDSFKGLDEFQSFTQRWGHEAWRVLKPTGLLAVFAAPRIAHRTAVGLEACGFVILDQVVWLFGNGAGINVKHGRLKPGHEVIILAALNRNTRLRVEDRQIVAEGQPTRQPTNVTLSEVAAEELDRTIGPLTSGARRQGVRSTIGMMKGSKGDDSPPIVASRGSASRYFYIARYRGHGDRPAHVTVKPLDLMVWVLGLVADPGQRVLDPFMGSGTTAIAAESHGCRWIGFESDEATATEARRRITALGDQREPLPLDGGA
jgi:site-specific DNA-methyltransferase (adenine-specific)